MRRREFLGILGALAALPLATQAQPSKEQRRLGMLLPRTDPRDAEVAAGLQRLRELGCVDGQNLRIEYRWTPGVERELLRAHAAGLVNMAPDVIWVLSNPAVAALQHATRTIPLVFVQVADPVGSGFVESLARPGNNTTGFTNFEGAMGGKWLEMLKELAPRTARVLVLFHPQIRAHNDFVRSMQDAAPALEAALTLGSARDRAEIEHAIASFPHGPDGGVLVLPSPAVAIPRDLIIASVAQRRLPAVYPFRYYAASGGLLSYGSDATDLWRRSASYVDRILRGEKPSELPVQAPVKFELVVNSKTAKAIDFPVPLTLLARADEVIE